MCDIAIDSAGPGAGKLRQVKGSGIFRVFSSLTRKLSNDMQVRRGNEQTNKLWKLYKQAESRT